ncbi:hypothetical protein EVAR_39981_1 [Eumeta japonica]|uniref:Uncharacterized protein n=1 Tax=Eumeta variegata TaxID=151549 RepID=A0A4C1YEW1_EUMVA|nr:hypothetical protein EVAR_39981_1 [Eumeta japonica]
MVTLVVDVLLSSLIWGIVISNFASRSHSTQNISNFQHPAICGQLDLLALKRHVASLCILYCICYRECSEQQFNLIPISIVVRIAGNILSTISMAYVLPSYVSLEISASYGKTFEWHTIAVFPWDYDKRIFKKKRTPI